MASEYEIERNKRIAANKEQLMLLGIGCAQQALKSVCAPKPAPSRTIHPRARALGNIVPSRRSPSTLESPAVCCLLKIIFL